MIFARYAARLYAMVCALTLVCLGAVIAVVRLVEQADVLRSRGDLVTTLRIAGWLTVEQVHQVWPIAMFLAWVITVTLLRSRGELTGAQALGLGPWRCWGAVAALMLVVLAMGQGLGEWAVPKAVARTQTLFVEELGTQPGKVGRYYQRRSPWFFVGDTLLHLPRMNPGERAFLEPLVYELRAGELMAMTEAQALRFQQDGWLLQKARRRPMHGPPELGPPQDRTLELGVSFDDLQEVTGHPRHLSSAAVKRLIERRQRAGLQTTAHETEWWGRLWHPMLGLWMVLLSLVATRWSPPPGRGASITGALGGAVVVVAVVLGAAQVGRVLALGEYLSPAWGALLPGAMVVCLLAVTSLTGRAAKRRP